MTDEVAELVLEDNRLQSLALSIAEAGGAQALPGHVRTIELLEASGRLDRKVEGLASSEELIRRAQENRGLTRPELAVVLSISKLVLQDAAEELRLSEDKVVEPQLFDAFPKPMRKAHADAIRAHRLRNEIIATKVANRLVNRLGPGRRVRPDRGRRRVAPAGRRGVPRRRAAARPRQAVAARSSRTLCPRRCGSSCSRSPRRAFARILSDILRVRPAARPASKPCASCSSPAFARFPRRRPSSSAPKSATRPRPAAIA